MVLLGWAVRGAPQPVDSWFQRLGSDLGSRATVFLGITTPAVLIVALLVGIVVAIRQHRKRLALAMVVSPLVAIAIVRVCKPIFGREKGGALAYPSGHTTFLVVVAGLRSSWWQAWGCGPSSSRPAPSCSGWSAWQ